MTGFKSDFLNEMQWRGYIHQITDDAALDAALTSGETAPVCYIGFDATGTSLHIGSLVQIMMLRRFQQFGGKPIALMGGGTSRIGDPSGKDTQRSLLDDAALARNLDGIAKAFDKFLTFGDGPSDAIMVNNDDWLKDLNYISFLRDYGRHFSVNQMLARDAVKMRLEREQPLSFLEFNYMILQAYDYLELHKRFGCVLQMGGSDQWGNIVSGIDLTRRMAGGAQVFGLTTPLVTTASGAKMGKTEDGAVWLNADMLAPYDYFQYWRNVEDADVGRFLRLFTDLPKDEIERLEALEGAEINDAKKVLAREASAMLHGKDAAEQALVTAQKTFEQGASADGLPGATAPLGDGIGLLDLLVVELDNGKKLAQTKSEARRLVQQGGIRINDEQVTDITLVVTADHIGENDAIKLSAGKKRHALIRAAG
ncbi:MAG: tyrosine--tRNA ligase [Alphaproteobacteria bacterium]